MLFVLRVLSAISQGYRRTRRGRKEIQSWVDFMDCDGSVCSFCYKETLAAEGEVEDVKDEPVEGDGEGKPMSGKKQSRPRKGRKPELIGDDNLVRSEDPLFAHSPDGPVVQPRLPIALTIDINKVNSRRCLFAVESDDFRALALITAPCRLPLSGREAKRFDLRRLSSAETERLGKTMIDRGEEIDCEQGVAAIGRGKDKEVRSLPMI